MPHWQNIIYQELSNKTNKIPPKMTKPNTGNMTQ